MSSIELEFDKIIAHCKAIFTAKLSDYGPTWLIYRPVSFADQLWIKAKRIRTLEENNDNKLVDEGREPEYYGIINYCVIYLITILFPEPARAMLQRYENNEQTDAALIASLYDKAVACVKDLLYKKNHDYNDAWRDMDIRSITDQILIKISRIKNILASRQKLLVSEDTDAQLSDIINYCVFALIKLGAGR